MKRRDLIKLIEQHAQQNDLPMSTREGGSHTVVYVGDKRTTVPRHNEVNEITAQKILKQIGAKP